METFKGFSVRLADEGEEIEIGEGSEAQTIIITDEDVVYVGAEVVMTKGMWSLILKNQSDNSA